MASRGLGRGLDSLIPKNLKAAEPGAQTSTVPIAQIRANPYQPRQRFNEETLKDLSDSIRQQGLLQPIVVTRIAAEDPSNKDSHLFELIAGERRWRAAGMAGLSEVPVLIRQATEKEKFQFSLIENLQREDLNPIEEARAFKRLMEEFDLSQEDLSRVIGKARTVIANTLRLLNLPSSLRDAVSDGTISAGHARNLVSIGDEKVQRETAEKILLEKITVRQVEKIVSDWKQAVGSGQVSPLRGDDPEVRILEESLQKSLGRKVQVVARGKGKDTKGKVVLSFYSLEDLERLVEALRKAGSQAA